jgi:hypothetical protein
MNPHEMKITAREQEQIDWCFAVLTEEQIVECEEEAAEVAGAELHQEEAAELLVKLYARLVVRNVRAERTGGQQ